MNKNAKRRLSAFLTFTLIVSSMTVNNVNTFAENEGSPEDGFALMEVDETVSEDALDVAADEAVTDDFAEGEVVCNAVVEETGDPDFFDCVEFSDVDTAAIALDTVLIDNEYGKMMAAQALKSANFIARGLQPVELDGFTYDAKIQSTSVDTTINEMTGNTGAPAGLYRLAYKIVAKQDCKVTVYANNGNHALLLDEHSADGNPADIAIGVGTEMGYGIAKDLAFIEGRGKASADIDKGQIVYFGGQYTNDNFLGVRISASSESVNVKVKLSVEGDKVDSLNDVQVSGFRASAASASTHDDCEFDFTGLASYDYTITATNGVVGGGTKSYQGVLHINDDGTYDSTLELKLVAEQGGITVVDENGSPRKNVRVTLDYVDVTTPKREQAYTNDAGFADFGVLGYTDYTVTVDGFDVDKKVFSPTKGNAALTVTATPMAALEVPYNAQAGDTFVGYAASDRTYYSIQEAVDAAAEGGTVYVAPGEYRGRVSITKSVNIVGVNKDNTIIAYNDSQQGTDTGVPKTRFHGDTVVINAANATVNFENITIANDAESTIPGIVQNATALSSFLENEVTANTINVKNCNLKATRDTIYTGPATSKNQWTFSKCNIYGFQDVCCGGGDAYINDCTWFINFNGDARFLVPICRNDGDVSFMKATNLTITLADEFVKAGEQGASFTKKAYLGRPWGNGPALSSTTQAIIDGYIDDAKLVPSNMTFGYDADNGLSAVGDLGGTNWLVNAGQDNVFYSTRWININKYNKNLSGNTVDGSYQLVGDFNQEFKDEFDTVGFAFFDEDNNFVGLTSSKSAYTIQDSEDTTAHTVAYVDNVPKKFKVKSSASVGNMTYIFGSNNAVITVS